MENEQGIIDWLLEKDNPSIRYRTLTELLSKDPNDKEIKAIHDEIIHSKPVQSIFQKMNPEGYWIYKNSKNRRIFGDGVEYSGYSTTHFALSYLAELGLNNNNPLINKASERYLNLQLDNGDWWNNMSCLIALNVRTFLMLGYRDDIRIQKAIDLLLKTERFDGGYLCDTHENKYKAKKVKSCIRGSVKALMMFSLLPEYWEHKRCKELVSYFLNRNGIFDSSKKELFVNSDMIYSSFPVTWAANNWEILLSLSKMGYGKDESLLKAWDLLNGKKDSSGKYILDNTPSQCIWKVGKKNEPNKWLTFYILHAKKTFL